MPTSSRPAAITVVLVALAALVAGWWTYWFICDDSYIAFRYISNSMLGHGYVWNAPPFEPVEGYSSFLWIALLDVVWRLTGVQPPDAANPILLLFAMGSVAITARMVWELTLDAPLAKHRVTWLALVLFAVVSNRTFLAWSSSGLETAMFVFWVMACVSEAVFRPMTRPWVATLGVLAGILELARPDGLLFLLATGCMLGVYLVGRARQGALVAADALPALGFAIPGAHLLWRKQFYGEWVPNTAFAKHTAPWPEMGMNYVGGFILEYAYWGWILLALFAVVHQLRHGHAWREAASRIDEAMLYKAAGPAAIVLHWGYYTLRIGGDHFEFRVYTQLVPLLAVSTVWWVQQLDWSARRGLIFTGVVTAWGLMIPWTHWAHTHDITKRHVKGMPHYTVAKHFPTGLAWYASAWDTLQGITIHHWVGMRAQTHKIFCMTYQWQDYPTRAEGEAFDPGGNPVFTAGAVGYPSWVLPHVAILDTLGLNDRVIARNPTDPLTKDGKPKRRRMAHERKAPPGYIPCFRPNVKVRKGVPQHTPRTAPLSDDDIRDCEQRFYDEVVLGQSTPTDGA